MGIMDNIRDAKDDMAGDTDMQQRYEELRAKEADGTLDDEGRIELERIRQKLNM